MHIRDVECVEMESFTNLRMFQGYGLISGRRLGVKIHHFYVGMRLKMPAWDASFSRVNRDKGSGKFAYVVTGMLNVFSLDVYYLLDPNATLFFVTPYVAVKFRFNPEQLLEPFSIPFSISTPTGKPIYPTNMSPMGLELIDNECVSLGQTCIIIYLTLHYIALHIFVIGELDLVCC
ncbi:hypothetical protein MTR67_023620 [Solanum verrucosum]|uniref:Uncharacterized protein n=1 Tax=Solanum verrucosum TaxID=315347 RepID=A0AAF0TXT6_SOLVR|nr:hypothetical protein MTR67_023620 [Solanum verrucosum]